MVAIGLVLDGDSTCRRRLVVSPSWSYEYLLQRISSLFHDLEIEKVRVSVFQTTGSIRKK